jgi:hypothetical protein
MNTNHAPISRSRRGLPVLAISVVAALVVPAAGWADSITLTVPPSTPEQEIGWQASCQHAGGAIPKPSPQTRTQTRGGEANEHYTTDHRRRRDREPR